jgi:hypothetical protein
MQRRNYSLFVLVCSIGFTLLTACDLQAAQTVPTRIAESLPRPTAEGAAPAPEQPAPEQPAPEQPAPEQPAPEQPAPEQPAPEQPAPEQPAPEQQQPPQSNPAAAINWLLIWLIVGVIAVIYLIGRSVGRNTRPQPPTPPSVQTNINIPTASLPAAPLPAAPAPSGPPAAAIEVQRRFVFYPGTDTIPPQDNPPIYDRSHQITVTLTRTAGLEEGILLACGTMQAGYALFIQGNRLNYVLALGAIVRQIVANSEMPIGPSEVRFEFNRTGPFRGTGALFVNGQLVGAQIFEQTLPMPASEGLDIGIDRGVPVSNTYPAPFPFGGVIQSVVYEITPDSSVDAPSV